MKEIILTVFAVLTAITLQAQIISGYVKDALSGETLAGATIVNESDEGSTTNDHGFFSVNGHTITISFLGYSPQTITVKKDTTVTIHLIQRLNEMAEVVITGKTPIASFSKAGEIKVNVSQLKYAPLFFGEQDVFKFLQILPGVLAGKDGMSGLLVRGGSSDQTQIVLDDIPLYNQSHAFGIVSIFSGESIKSADIYKGYISSGYGGRLSALTSVRLRDGNRYEHKQALNIGTVTVSTTLEGPIVRERGSYLFSARYFLPELFMKVWFKYLNAKKSTTDIDYSFYDLTGKLVYDLSKKNTLFLSLYSGQDGFHMGAKNGETDFISKHNADFGWGNTIASLRLNSKLSNKIFSNTTLYYSRLTSQQNTAFKSLQNTLPEDSLLLAYSEIKSQVHELGGRFAVEHTINHHYCLSYGLNASHYTFMPLNSSRRINGQATDLEYRQESMISAAFYIDNSLKFGATEMNIGIRGSIYHKPDALPEKWVFIPEPRFRISYGPSRQWSVWGSVTRNSQALTQFYRYMFSMPVDFWAPYPGEKVQTSEQVSIGGQYHMKSGLSLTAEAYYKWQNNLPLIFDSDDFLTGDGGYVSGKGKIFGVEAMLQYNHNRFNASFSYTFARSQREAADMLYSFEYDVPHNMNCFVYYDLIKRPGRRHTFSINICWHTGYPFRISQEVYPAT
ncbi:MAG: TonB-dependent receptor, partial [Bacteroidales bacterium]